MNKQFTPVVNIQDLEPEPFRQGDHYESLDAGISERVGLTQLGAAYCVVPPGKSGCPFHVHHVEDELFVILEGTGVYRFGGTKHPIKSGDVLGAPRGGPEFAHKITNTGTVPLRYLAISSKADTEVCEYPDSGKFLVASRRSLGREKALRFIGRLGESRDYWEGEDAAD